MKYLWVEYFYQIDQPRYSSIFFNKEVKIIQIFAQMSNTSPGGDAYLVSIISYVLSLKQTEK